jgi:hypothetical protein
MTAYVKRNGIWVAVKDMYIKDSGVWVQSEEGYFRQGIDWDLVHTKPGLPPPGPVLSLQDKKTISGIAASKRYIEVGIRHPSSGDSTALRRVRVLISSTSQPSTQFGSGFIDSPAISYKNEPWSDWYYDAYVDEGGTSRPDTHGSSNAFTYKEYNPGWDPSLAGNKTYYVSAWCQNTDDQWSVGTFDSIFLPSQFGTSQPIYKKMVVNPNAVRGIAYNTTAGAWEPVSNEDESQDDVITQVNRGGIVWYGNKVISPIPSGADITKARVRISRRNDTYNATANIYARWHNEVSDDLETVFVDDIVNSSSEIALLGTINKGETKWFNLPSAWHDNLAGGFRGLVITRNTSGGSTADHHWLYGVLNSTRAFELEVEWTENP